MSCSTLKVEIRLALFRNVGKGLPNHTLRRVERNAVRWLHVLREEAVSWFYTSAKWMRQAVAVHLGGGLIIIAPVVACLMNVQELHTFYPSRNTVRMRWVWNVACKLSL
jgi:hypothetical protein